MVGGKHGGCGNRLINRDPAGIVALQLFLRLFRFFGAQYHANHRLDCLDRVLPRGGFCREHDRVCAIEHRVGHIEHFSSGGQRAADHGFHHLSGGNHASIQRPGSVDDMFLHTDQRCIANFNTQVPSCHHHSIGGEDNCIEHFVVFNCLGALDLRYQRYISARLLDNATRKVHVIGTAGERHRQVVHAYGHGRFNVFAVFIGQSRCRQAAALAVNTFVVRKLTAHGYGTVDAPIFNRINDKHHPSIVKQQQVCRLHVVGELFVVDAHLLLVAGISTECRVQYKRLANLQGYGALGKTRDTNLGTLQVTQNRDVLVVLGRQLANFLGAFAMIIGRAVGEIHAHYVDARFDQPFQYTRLISGWPQSTYDFCTPQHISPKLGSKTATNSTSFIAAIIINVRPISRTGKKPTGSGHFIY